MSSKASVQWVHQHAPGLNQLVSQRSEALWLDEHDQTLGLPLGRPVRRELLVLRPAVAARLVAVEEGYHPLTIYLLRRGGVA